MNEPVPTPPNLAPLYEGVLDADGLASLLRDIAECTELMEVRVRAAPGAQSAAERPELQHVLASFAAGTVSAAQVAYRYDGALWVDTLLARGAPPGGARVVRSQTPVGAEP